MSVCVPCVILQALAALFLMNNVHYIVKAVESNEALSCVGQDWIERHKDLIETYGEEYQVGPLALPPLPPTPLTLFFTHFA